MDGVRLVPREHTAILPDAIENMLDGPAHKIVHAQDPPEYSCTYNGLAHKIFLQIGLSAKTEMTEEKQIPKTSPFLAVKNLFPFSDAMRNSKSK